MELKKTAVRAALALATAALVLGVLEGVLRVLPLEQSLRSDWNPGGLVDHAVFWAPLGETENPVGASRYWQPLRGAHPNQQPDPDVIRIVCLGGSSTYGWPFEQASIAYPAQLEQALNGTRRGRYEVINAGEGGFTSFQALVYLQERLVHYRPALVTFCFGANDGNDNSEIGTAMTDEEYWDWLQKAARGGRAWKLHEAARALRLYILIKRAVHETRVALLPYVSTPRRRVPVDRFEANANRLVELGKTHGFRPVFLSEAHREPGARAEYRAAMERVAAATGARYIDLHSLLPADPKERATLFIDEMHLTQEGHRRAAAILATELTRGGP